jgi:hypothetical protein
MKRLTLLLALGLVGCGAFPLRFGVDNISLNIPLVTYTSGNVIFPKNASTFNQAPISYTSVKLEGNAKASNVLQDVNVFLYARSTDPSLDPTCSSYTDIIVCPKTGQTKINTNPLSLLSSGVKRNFVFDDAGNGFRDGINAGKIWLGLEVASGAAANMNLQMTDLVMSLTVL